MDLFFWLIKTFSLFSGLCYNSSISPLSTIHYTHTLPYKTLSWGFCEAIAVAETKQKNKMPFFACLLTKGSWENLATSSCLPAFPGWISFFSSQTSYPVMSLSLGSQALFSSLQCCTTSSSLQHKKNAQRRTGSSLSQDNKYSSLNNEFWQRNNNTKSLLTSVFSFCNLKYMHYPHFSQNIKFLTINMLVHLSQSPDIWGN